MIDLKRRELIELIDADYVKNPKYGDTFKDISIATEGALTPMLVGNILYGETTLSSLKDEELYWLIYGINKVLKTEIDLKNYFLDSDIDRAEDFKDYEKSIEKDTTFKIDNVVEVIENKEWLVPNVEIQQIDKYFQDGLITYNPKTQRPLKTKKYGKKIVKRIDINEASTIDIADAMESGRYSPTVMTINILSSTTEDEEGEIVQNESFKFVPYKDVPNELGLTIGYLEVDVDTDKPLRERKRELDMTDGFHRREGIAIVLRRKPDIQQKMHLKVTRMTEKEARNLIDIENKRNIFKEESLGYYQTTDVNNSIVDDLNTKGLKTENIMRDEIVQNREDALLLNKFTTYEILMTSIKDIFNIKKDDIIKRAKVSNFLNEFFNNLMYSIAINENLNRLDGKSIEKNRRISYALEPNTFYGYISLAGYFYENKKEWKEKLNIVIQSIDFNKQDGELKELKLNSNNVGNKYRKKIYDTFIEKIM